MKTLSKNSVTKRDLLKVLVVAGVLFSLGAIFFVTPALSTPTLLAVISTLLLSPLVAAMERRGIPKIWAIFILFSAIGALLAWGSVKVTQSALAEWGSFTEKAPRYFELSVQRMDNYESQLKGQYPFLENLSVTQSIVSWGEETGKWFLVNGPKLVGDILTWLLIVPILTFFLLKDGRKMRKTLFTLVPNRFFETSFMVSSRISDGLADYIRAKLVEAFLVGLMTYIGLEIVGAPYSLVLAIIAGVTNIIPYAGPFLGAIPAILVVFFDPVHTELTWSVVAVIAIANVIDFVLIFPVLVAKLVDLHPLFLIAAVVVGQQYYGLVGMLISIPLATTLKVVFQEFYSVVYESPNATYGGTPAIFIDRRSPFARDRRA